MKKSFSLMMLAMMCFGFFTACEDEEVVTPDPVTGCGISERVVENYTEDAIRLALRLQQEGPAANEIQIPEPLINRMLGAIGAIVDERFTVSPEFIARDSVIETYDIHTLDYPAFDEFTLQVDTSFAWVKNWVDGSRLTDNSSIDQLMNIYGLDIDGVNTIEVEVNGVMQTVTTANLVSAEPLNLAGLITAFEGIDGVINGSFRDSGGDGNDITVEDNGSFVALTFTLAYDAAVALDEPCVGECEFERSWVFHVSDSEDACSATFEGSFGDDAP